MPQGADAGSRRLAWCLKLGVGLLLLALAFRGVSLREVVESFRRVDPRWLTAAIASVFLTVSCVVMRWRTLLGAAAGAGELRVLASAVVASQVANIVTPFRLGDAVRIGAVSRALRLPPGAVLGSVAVERLFDGLLVALAAGALAVSGALPPFARAGMVSLALSMGAALAAALLVVRYRGVVERLLTRTRILPGAAGAWILRQTEHVLRGMRRVMTPTVGGRAFLWSAAVLSCSMLTAWLVLRACHVDAPAAAAVVAVIAVQIGSVVVPIPGAVGISQVLTVQTLRLWGVADAPALAYALVLYLVSRVPKVAVLPLAVSVLTATPMEKA